MFLKCIATISLCHLPRLVIWKAVLTSFLGVSLCPLLWSHVKWLWKQYAMTLCIILLKRLLLISHIFIYYKCKCSIPNRRKKYLTENPNKLFGQPNILVTIYLDFSTYIFISVYVIFNPFHNFEKKVNYLHFTLRSIHDRLYARGWYCRLTPEFFLFTWVPACN